MIPWSATAVENLRTGYASDRAEGWRAAVEGAILISQRIARPETIWLTVGGETAWLLPAIDGDGEVDPEATREAGLALTKLIGEETAGGCT